MGKPRCRWEDGVWKKALDLPQMRSWKAMAAKAELEEGDQGGHGPRTCRSALQDENVDSGKRNFEAGNA